MKRLLGLLAVPAAALAAVLFSAGTASAQTPPAHVTVASGDTLWAIGIRAGVPWQTLAAWNSLANPNLIFPGQVIYLGPTGVVVNYPPASSRHVVTTPTPATSSSWSAPVRQNAVYSAPAGSFQACVMFRESTNGAGSSNLYGILQSTWASLGLTGSPYSASRAQQDAAFNELYARDGTAPWAPYDGC